jgi:hypothetical protein
MSVLDGKVALGRPEEIAERSLKSASSSSFGGPKYEVCRR